MPPKNKIIWTEQMLDFLKSNYTTMNNQQLADGLGLRITAVRMQLYSMGLKRMELEYWTDEQVQYLKNNYKKIGDVEMAEIFQDRWPKNKGWTKKHIEKKRKYLQLNRTLQEQIKVHERNLAAGRFKANPVYAWDKRGRSPVGAVRIWRDHQSRPCKFIKTTTGWTPYAPWLWKQHNGPVPEGYMVTFKDGDNLNVVLDNLQLMTRGGTLARLRETLPDRYVASIMSYGDKELRNDLLQHPELLQIKRAQILVTREIKKLQSNGQSDRKRNS